MKTKHKTCLSIGGFDPSCKAGLHADLKAYYFFDVPFRQVATCITAQNTNEFIAYKTTTLFNEQIHAIKDEVSHIKTGMLTTTKQASSILELNFKSLICDPVLFSSSKKQLIPNKVVEFLQQNFFQRCTLLTPNSLELELLTQKKASSQDDLIKQCFLLAKKYNCNVYLKGGHTEYNATDILCYNKSLFMIETSIVDNVVLRGSGCTFASAISANLAKGKSLFDACIQAKKYIFYLLNKSKESNLEFNNNLNDISITEL